MLEKLAALTSSEVSSIELDIGDQIRYTDENKTIEGIISRVQETASGRKAYTLTQPFLGNGYELDTTRFFADKGAVEVISRGGDTHMVGLFAGMKVPLTLNRDDSLRIHLDHMLKNAHESLLRARIEDARPKFWIGNSAEFCDAPQGLIDRFNRAESKGDITILTVGISSRYAVYEKGFKTGFNGDWELVSQGPAGEDVVKQALRYRADSDIIAMTHAAQVAVKARAAEFDALRLADAEKKATLEAVAAIEGWLCVANGERLSKIKFKKETIEIKVEGSIDLKSATVEAETYQGLAVHQKFGSAKGYAVTHVGTGLFVIPSMRKQTDARLAAARLASVVDMRQLTRKEDVQLAAFDTFRAIANAIREAPRSKHFAFDDALANPLLDRHLLTPQTSEEMLRNLFCGNIDDRITSLYQKVTCKNPVYEDVFEWVRTPDANDVASSKALIAHALERSLITHVDHAILTSVYLPASPTSAPQKRRLGNYCTTQKKVSWASIAPRH